MTTAAAYIREHFRFTLVPTLFTVPALILLIGLGTWQVQRLHWKTALIAERRAGFSAPAVALPGTLAEAQSLEYRHVTVRGTFDHTKELHIAAEDENGTRGWQIVTPLTLADGHILLVNRGFVPEWMEASASRAAGQIAGEVEVDGILRIEHKPTGWIIPANQPKQNFWLFVDVPQMTEADGLDPARVLPFFVEAGSTPNPGGLPIGGQTRINLPNDHLQYAITWYSFAVALTVIYLVYHYRKPEP
ncbi:MAG TPA: SURF1 family protein [Stellaceae bacterium]|nr:SURF1 family protein [Stellaceae bacterium]